MTTISKKIRFEEVLCSQIQRFANDNHNGNFTAAVNDLAARSLLVEHIEKGKKK